MSPLFVAREKLGGHRCTGDKKGSIPGFWHVFLWLADMLQQLTRWCYLKGAFPSWTWKQLTNYSRPIEVFTSPFKLVNKTCSFLPHILQLNKHMNLRIVDSFHMLMEESRLTHLGCMKVFEHINLNCRISRSINSISQSSGEQCNADDHVNLRCSRRYFTTSSSELHNKKGHPLGVFFLWKIEVDVF